MREWDTCIVWNVRRERWWWNAWRESTSTELSGFADTQEQALRDLTAAINKVTPTGPIHPVHRARAAR